MNVKVSTDWSFNGMQTILLENERLRVVIIPELGAKIWELIYKPKYRNLLWQHPRLKPRPLPFHSVYDDVFFGGWDELYPNDTAETINGEQEPDHGEIWTLPWEFALVKASEEEVTVHLWVDTAVHDSRMEKWITLRRGEAKLRFRHRLTNRGNQDMPFLWKLHAAVAVNEHSRIDLGAKTMYIEDFGPTRIGRTGVQYEWPYAIDDQGNQVDMRRVLPESSGINEFQYGTELTGGWCAVTDTAARVGMGIAFDLAVFPSCWTFATYGGWRNLNTVILEPCTGYPVSVNDGIAANTHQTLKAGQTIETEVTAVAYEGLTAVSSIDLDGNVL